jgi:hypothetical protein
MITDRCAPDVFILRVCNGDAMHGTRRPHTLQTMNKQDKIYIAGHRGMVGSAIVRKLQKPTASPTS